MVIAARLISVAVLCRVGAYQVSTHKFDRLKEHKIMQQRSGLKPCCYDIKSVSDTIPVRAVSMALSA
tara:strand:+ start:560 stop:760 length:201 start_codon:yes stop_codon:yes gene_type:complete